MLAYDSMTFGIMRKWIQFNMQYNMHWSTQWLLPNKINITFIYHKFDVAMHTNRERILNVDNTMMKWKRSFNLIRFEKSHSIQHYFPHFPREKGSSSGAVSDTLFTLPPPRIFHLSFFSTLFPFSHFFLIVKVWNFRMTDLLTLCIVI